MDWPPINPTYMPPPDLSGIPIQVYDSHVIVAIICVLLATSVALFLAARYIAETPRKRR